MLGYLVLPRWVSWEVLLSGPEVPGNANFKSSSLLESLLSPASAEQGVFTLQPQAAGEAMGTSVQRKGCALSSAEGI